MSRLRRPLPVFLLALAIFVAASLVPRLVTHSGLAELQDSNLWLPRALLKTILAGAALALAGPLAAARPRLGRVREPRSPDRTHVAFDVGGIGETRS